MAEPILVVDFGGFSTAAALVVGERAALIREPLTGAAVWPSILGVEAGMFVAGSAAEHTRRIAPGQFMEGPRRALDHVTMILLGGHHVAPVEALAAFLTSLRTEARRVCADQVDRLTLTVPAWYPVPDRRRDLLIEAGEAAGFLDVELVGDVSAVVVEAQTNTGWADGTLVLVCDLGDTWTTALAQVGGPHGEVGLFGLETSTAGRDIDTMLLDDLCTQGGGWLEPRLLEPGDAGLRARYEAADFLRRLKHDVIDKDEVAAPLDGMAREYRLTRDWLERLAEPGLRWAAASCRSLVARAAAGFDGLAIGGPGAVGPGTVGGSGAVGSGAVGHSGGVLSNALPDIVAHRGPARGIATQGVAPGSVLADVAAVVLVGGAARLPNAERIIQESLHRPVLVLPEPDLAVLRGAVRWVAAASTRRLLAEHPKWRVEPLAWSIPGGRGRLVRWLVAEGRPYSRGAVLAQVRTPDERVFDLTAPDEGVLLPQRIRVGDPVGPTLLATTKRPASCLTGDPPGKRQELTATGEWLLALDRDLLVECAPRAAHVKLWSIPDGDLLSAFRPALDGVGPHHGRVFVAPSGRLSLVAWDPTGMFSVFDVQSGRCVVTFRNAHPPFNVMVNESVWRLTTQADDSGAAGRYRRAVSTVWDLRTGQRVEKVTADAHRALAGYRDRSIVDGFGDRAVSPDGRLQAVPVRTLGGSTAIALQESASDHEVFRAEHRASPRVRMAFSADGRFLLANWESDDHSEVDVWEL